MAFEWFPFLSGKYLTYNEYLALSGSLFFIIASLFWFIILIIHKKYHQYAQKKYEVKMKFDSVIFNSQESQEPNFHTLKTMHEKSSEKAIKVTVNQDKYESLKREQLIQPLIDRRGSDAKPNTVDRHLYDRSGEGSLSSSQRQVNIQREQPKRAKTQLKQRGKSPRKTARDLIETQQDEGIHSRLGFIQMILSCLLSVSIALIMIPLYGLRMIPFWVALLFIFGVAVFRYFALIYSDYKFILFDIKLLDIPLIEVPETEESKQTETQIIDYQLKDTTQNQILFGNSDKSWWQKMKLKFSNYRQVIFFYSSDYPIRFTLYIVALFLLSMLTSLFFADICVDYSDFSAKGWTIPFFGVSVSTRIMRSWTYDEPCPTGKPCHVFITLPEQASTQMFVNFHINNYSCQNLYCYTQVLYRKANNDQNEPYSVSIASQIGYNPLNHQTTRQIYSAYLKNLEQDTLYEFKISYLNEDSIWNDTYYSKTLPNDKQSIKISYLSTMTSQKLNIEMYKKVSKEKPDLIVLNGNVIFNYGLPQCYQLWDYLLKDLTTYMFTSESQSNIIIPMIIVPGSQEIGRNALVGDTITSSDMMQNTFFSFFPQHESRFISNTGSEIDIQEETPKIESRTPFFKHYIDNLLLLTIDYDYFLSPNQEKWIQNTLNTNYSTSLDFYIQYVPQGSFDQQTKLQTQMLTDKQAIVIQNIDENCIDISDQQDHQKYQINETEYYVISNEINNYKDKDNEIKFQALMISYDSNLDQVINGIYIYENKDGVDEIKSMDI